MLGVRRPGNAGETMSDDREPIRLSLLAMEETARAIAAELESDRVIMRVSDGTASPTFLRQLNALLIRVNELVPDADLALFDEQSSPTQADYPRALELLNQIKLALAFLGGPEEGSRKRRSSEPQEDQSARSRPEVFIGCSVEGLRVAKVIQLALEHSTHSVIWHQGVFGLSQGTLESLVAAVHGFQYAVLVLTPDDLVVKREETRAAARDNVLFELGLFMGALGRDRTFIVCERSVSLPTDLAGVTPAVYEVSGDTTLVQDLGPVCTKLELAMGVL